MSRIALFWMSFLVIALLVGCNSGGTFEKPNPTGKSGEVAIVVDGRLRGDTAVKYLKAVMTQPVDGLPQIEPLFDVTVIPADIFSAMFRMMRNLIIITINPECPKETIRYSNNVWANNQAIVRIEVKSDSSLLAFIKKNENKLPSYFLKEERKRYAQFYSANSETSLVDSLIHKFNAQIAIPAGYSFRSSSNDFIWVGQNVSNIQQGLFVYSVPLNGKKTLSKEYILQMRDSVLKRNVPSTRSGSFMTTEHQFEPLSKIIVVNGIMAMSVSGLWHIQGDFMGGPFVLTALPNVKRDKIVVLDGFVYSPEKPNKRNYIRQLEAIIETVKFKEFKNDTSRIK